MSAYERSLRRKYQKPPIAQVVCEFLFRGASDWDWTIPGLVYQEIKSEFPEKRQEQTFEIKFEPVEGKVERNIGSPSKMLFLRGDGSAMVQVGPDLLAINVLAAYPGWESFASLIKKQFSIYTTIAKPIGFRRIGLRYINKILFPTKFIETTEFFYYYPHLPETVEQKHGPFAMRVIHDYETERDLLTVNMGTMKSDDSEKLTIGLDLDYHLARPDDIKLVDGLEWVDVAHDRIGAMFEACITDAARTLFEEIG